jgi:fructose-1-phosphate kinase PfkB-like protein
MSRRVATITLNPAYDLVGFCPEIERGEVNLVRTTGLHAAGKGINVAKVLKDLGIDVTVGGFLGKDNQDGFQQLFSELGIANRFQVVQGRTCEKSALISGAFIRIQPELTRRPTLSGALVPCPLHAPVPTHRQRRC